MTDFHISLGDEDKGISLKFTADGIPSKPPAVPVWTIADPTVATITPSADGLTCDVRPVAVGTTTYTVTSGTLTATGAVNVSEPTATAMTVVDGTIVPVPAPVTSPQPAV